jgi:hypothetical protein
MRIDTNLYGINELLDSLSGSCPAQGIAQWTRRPGNPAELRRYFKKGDCPSIWRAGRPSQSSPSSSGHSAKLMGDFRCPCRSGCLSTTQPNSKTPNGPARTVSTGGDTETDGHTTRSGTWRSRHGEAGAAVRNRHRGATWRRPPSMSLRRRFLARLRECVADDCLSLRIIFWDGEVFDFAEDPAVAIVLRSPHLSRFLLSGDIARLGQAYAEGEIDVEGRLQYILQAVWRLPSGSANRRPSAS